MQSRRRFLTAALTGTTLAIAGCSYLEQNDNNDNSGGDGGENGGSSGNGGSNEPAPRTLVDDTRTIQEDEYRYWEFTLDRQATLELSAFVRDGPAADMFLTSSDEFNQFEQEHRFRYNSAVSLMDSTGGSTSGTVSAGSYVFVLDNTNMGEAQPPTNFDEDPAMIEVTLRAIY